MRAMAQRSWAKDTPLELVELPVPELRPDELRVSVRAVGVNPVDWKLRSGGVVRIAARLLGVRPPIVPGVDFAGVVEAVGPRVTGVRPGDRVVGATDLSRRQRGSYADTVVVREDQVCPLPDALELDTASGLPVPGVTAQMALVDVARIARVPQDARRVLVLGASGAVGQLAVQLGKIHAAFVVGVCSGKNTELVRELGADVVLDYTAGDPLSAASAHGPYQAVIDCVGAYGGRGCRSLLRSGGRHVIIAGDSPGNLGQVLVPPFTSRAILGKPRRAQLEPLVAAAAAGRLRVTVTHRLRLEEAEEAQRLSRSGRMTGKIVLIP
jgi:NADPH:quinone reductase-like Zn-dependent oxidoreductase